MQQELQMEDKLIKQLTHGQSQWTLREDIKTEEGLWDNFFDILSRNNKAALYDVPLTDNEKNYIRGKVTHPTFYAAAKDITGANGQYRISLPRDDTSLGTISLLVIDHKDIAGGTSVYEVVHQIQMKKRSELDQNRRYDVTLLINGLPVIHIELKTPSHSPLEAFNQIQKYITEQKFNGIYSNVQMFVVTNGTDTKYVAAGQKLREKFLSGWIDNENNPVTNYLAFARDVLSIPMAHHVIADYSVLDSQRHNIILLRPYQIHAIENVLNASSRGQSGYIWHTTGSGKTLTSYRVAHNLLSIPSIDKVIFLIDRKDLDNQTTQAFQSYANTDSIDVNETESTYQLGQKLTNGDRNVLVTTRQKLQHLFKWSGEERNQKMFDKLKNLKLGFIVDECHRTITPESKTVIDKFFNIQPLWYGFTGTPIFSENKRAENGDAAQTTEQQYGPCLHQYTIKDAIRDKAVLGFHVNDMQNLYQDGDEEEDRGKLDKSYVSAQHMRSVAKNVLKLSYRKLGIYNMANRGYTYSALLTVKSTKMRPINQAKAYYRLFKEIKNGQSVIKVPQKIKEVLPDFPKVAITFSVSENEDQSISDQEFMKEAMDDYNHEYGTNYKMDLLNSYNGNINDRLARKRDEYKPQSERLDLVIVVDRLLTGFDSQYLSTLFVDRPPMSPQEIIQSFSRTNRIFDQDKRYGNIITFQYPKTFSDKIDAALKLYTNGGIGEVMAPSWKESKQKFDQAYKDIQNYQAANGIPILEADDDDQKLFIKRYQAFDKAFGAIQTYDEFDDINPDKDYSLTSDFLQGMQGAYKTLVDKFRKRQNDDNEDDEDPINTEYELTSIIDKSINYQYILSLMQNYVPDEGELLAQRNVKDQNEIDGYIDDLAKTNKPLATIVQQLWEQIKANPEKYAGKQVDQLLNQMLDQAYNQELMKFTVKYNVDLEKLRFVISNYDVNDDKHAGVKDLLTKDAYKGFKEKHADNYVKRMLDWRKQVRSQLNDLYVNRISPLLDK